MRIRSVLGTGTMVVVRLPLEAPSILPRNAGEDDCASTVAPNAARADFFGERIASRRAAFGCAFRSC